MKQSRELQYFSQENKRQNHEGDHLYRFFHSDIFTIWRCVLMSVLNYLIINIQLVACRYHSSPWLWQLRGKLLLCSLEGSGWSWWTRGTPWTSGSSRQRWKRWIDGTSRAYRATWPSADATGWEGPQRDARPCWTDRTSRTSRTAEWGCGLHEMGEQLLSKCFRDNTSLRWKSWWISLHPQRRRSQPPVHASRSRILPSLPKWSPRLRLCVWNWVWKSPTRITWPQCAVCCVSS